MYVLIKEVMDNSIDEYMMGHGKTIEVTIEGRRVTIRDYGRGIPLNKLSDAVSKMNTGGKFEDSTTFRKSVGLNGVGVKAVNALSSEFTVRSVRDGQARTVSFSRGYELSDRWEEGVQEKKRSVGELRPRRRRKRYSATTPTTTSSWNPCSAAIPISIRG